MAIIEAIPNVSERRRTPVVRRLVEAVTDVSGATLLDCTSEPSHNRSVLTLVGDPDGLTDAIGLYRRTPISRAFEAVRDEAERVGVRSVVAQHGVDHAQQLVGGGKDGSLVAEAASQRAVIAVELRAGGARGPVGRTRPAWRVASGCRPSTGLSASTRRAQEGTDGPPPTTADLSTPEERSGPSGRAYR